MKTYILFIFAFLFLASCGSKDSNTITFAGKSTQTVTGSWFSMPIPSDWTQTGTLITIPNDSKSRVVLGAVSPEKKYNFSENIMVIEQDMDAIGTSRQYSDHNFQSKKSSYHSLSLLKTDTILFADMDDSSYYVFDAKYNTQTPKIRFIQTAKFCGTKLYFLHAATHLGNKIDDYLALFRGFDCKKEK